MKKFLIIGNMNAVTHMEVIPLIKDNKVWLGANKRIMDFITSEGLIPINTVWFTNIGHNKRPKPLDLTHTYSAERYPKYDNYDAINVDKVKDIPYDYDGVIAAPITVLFYNPQQFEIIGCADANVLPNGWSGMTKEFLDLYYSQGGTGQYQVGNRLEFYITKDGKAKRPYKRILIKLKNLL